MANNIKSMNLKTEIQIGDNPENVISLDFSDRRFANRVLRLYNRYRNIEAELAAKFEGIDAIEDEIEKLLMYSDVEVELLEDFKKNINDTFGFDIVTKLYGDCLPQIDRYIELFESITPYVIESNRREHERVRLVQTKYNPDRIKKVVK